jgi:hypothetical protein
VSEVVSVDAGGPQSGLWDDAHSVTSLLVEMRLVGGGRFDGA